MPSSKPPKNTVHEFFGHVFTQPVINYLLFSENGESVNIILREISINGPLHIELKPKELISISHLLVNVATHFLLSWNAVLRMRKFLCGENIFNLKWRSHISLVYLFNCRAHRRESYRISLIWNYLVFIWSIKILRHYLFV